MLNRIVNINELQSSQSLVTRQTARELFTYISHLQEENISLDFSNISYASRSFFDELNSKKSELSMLGKKVEFINLTDELTQLYQIVISSATSRSSMVYSSVANVQMVTI